MIKAVALLLAMLAGLSLVALVLYLGWALLQMAGIAPQHIDIVRAMKAGNKWALGIAKPDGTPYPMPPWADPLVASWRIVETWGGVDGELAFDAGAFPDVEDDAAPLAEFVPSGVVNPWDVAAGQATNGADDDTLAAALAGPALTTPSKRR